ncbi:MAG: peptidylprolyl isomerase [Chloroflexota bacterium]|nr:MAG: peptidylprolyl isomerase [Chloroflexota bacterium]
MTIDPKKDYTATLRTNMGDIKIKLFAGEVPQTVNNFVFLARDGYYDGVRFHRVIKGFIIQSGDPTGTGTGTPGYRFKDEPITRDYEAGTLAMANAGPNTNGAQFFITHADMSGGKLPKNYTIFGKVMDQASMGVVDKIAAVPVQAIRGGELSSPMVDVHIDSVSIEELPALGTAVRVPPTATPVPPAVTPKPTYGPATPSAGAGTVIDEIGWVEVMFSGTVDLGQKTPTNLGQTLIFHGRKANYAIELLPEVKLQVPAEDKEAGGVAFRSGDSHQYLIKGSLSGNKSQGSIFVAGLPIVEVAYLERVK